MLFKNCHFTLLPFCRIYETEALGLPIGVNLTCSTLTVFIQVLLCWSSAKLSTVRGAPGQLYRCIGNWSVCPYKQVCLPVLALSSMNTWTFYSLQSEGEQVTGFSTNAFSTSPQVLRGRAVMYHIHLANPDPGIVLGERRYLTRPTAHSCWWD